MIKSINRVAVFAFLLCQIPSAFCTDWEKVDQANLDDELNRVNANRKELSIKYKSPDLTKKDRCKAKENWLEANLDWCKGNIRLAGIKHDSNSQVYYEQELHNTQNQLKKHRMSSLCRFVKHNRGIIYAGIGGTLFGTGIGIGANWDKIWGQKKNESTKSATNEPNLPEIDSTTEHDSIWWNPLLWLGALVVVVILVVLLWRYFSKDSEPIHSKLPDKSESEDKKQRAPTPSETSKTSAKTNGSAPKKGKPIEKPKSGSSLPAKNAKEKLSAKDSSSDTESYNSKETSIDTATKQYPKTSAKSLPTSKTDSSQAKTSGKPTTGAPPQQQFILKPSKQPVTSGKGSSASFQETGSSNKAANEKSSSKSASSTKTHSMSSKQKGSEVANQATIRSGIDDKSSNSASPTNRSDSPKKKHSRSDSRSDSAKSGSSKIDDTLSATFDSHKK